MGFEAFLVFFILFYRFPWFIENVLYVRETGSFAIGTVIAARTNWAKLWLKIVSLRRPRARTPRSARRQRPSTAPKPSERKKPSPLTVPSQGSASPPPSPKHRHRRRRRGPALRRMVSAIGEAVDRVYSGRQEQEEKEKEEKEERARHAHTGIST